MNSRRLTNILKGALVISCAVVFSLSASSVARANTRTKAPANASTMKRNSREGKRSLPVINDRNLNVNPKLLKALAKSCGCTLAADSLGGSGFKSCFKSCLQDNGINTMAAAACAATCAANPVGCVVCAGVAEWIVLGCAQYCVWRQVFYYTGVSTPPAKYRSVRPIRVSPQRAVAT